MAHFIGYIKGQRGEASRLGSKKSGLDATANGWHIGARICLRHNDETGKDELTVYKTGGSNGASESEKIAEFSE